jgi:hypothetical protein
MFDPKEASSLYGDDHILIEGEERKPVGRQGRRHSAGTLNPPLSKMYILWWWNEIPG